MFVLKFDGTVTDLSALSSADADTTLAKGFGPELNKNPFNATAKAGNPMPFPGGYKSGPLRSANQPPARSPYRK